MKIKFLFFILVICGFLLSFLPLGLTQTKIETKGSILRIEDKNVVIKNEQGKQVIIKLENAQGLKVGEKVEIKDGFLRIFDPKSGKERERKKLQPERPT
ncbi:MAG: hypothetical protein ACUVWV_14800 [Thermodesulfobacteriota bacterium]